MIYVWLNNMKKMHTYKTHEEYWMSYDYEFRLEGYEGFEPMVEQDTMLWKN